MTLDNSFGVLQQFSAAVTHADLCTSMDLCVIVTDDGLSLHRTVTWERVLFLKLIEAFDAGVTCVRFGSIGKVLTAGLADGSVAIIDIETGDIMSARKTTDSTENNPVVSMAWQRLPDQTDDFLDTAAMEIYGGLNQLQRGGQSEYSDPNSIHSTTCVDGISLSLTSPIAGRRDLTRLLSGHLLLSLTQDGCTHAFSLGVYPLFTVSLPTHQPSKGLTLVPMAMHTDMLLWSAAAGTCAVALPSLDHTRLRCYENTSSLHLCIESNLSRLLELVTSCGRKWKDACKVVLPKLSLLQTLLTSYEMQMTPIEFCYTITMCGLWHPAAATAFSQHWNDQGIQRLRATVEATTRSMIKQLLTKALPMATNSLLCTRELLGLSTQLQLPASDLQRLQELVLRHERVVLLLDSAVQETRLAREAMLLYIQFIKDCAYEAAVSENVAAASIPGTKPDISLRPKYQALFDPRCPRAPSTGAAAQAEHVTGTHLYAFLQDHAPASAAPSVSGGGRGSGGGEQGAAVEELLKTATQLSHLQHSSGMGDQPNAMLVSHVDKALLNTDLGRSLVHEIKAAKDVEHSLFFSIHKHLSARFTSNVHDSSSGGSGATSTLFNRPSSCESHHSRVVSAVTLHVARRAGAQAEEITLVECIMEAAVDIGSDSIWVSAMALGAGEDVTEVPGGPIGGDQVYAARLSLRSVMSGLTKERTPTMSVPTTVKVQLYCRPDASPEGSCEASVLLVLQIPAAEQDAESVSGVFLCKIALEDVVFRPVARTAAVAVLTQMVAQAIPADAQHSRKLSLRHLHSLCCSAERGVALVGDAAGKHVLVDVEGEEEGSDDESDGDGGSGAGSADSSAMDASAESS